MTSPTLGGGDFLNWSLGVVYGQGNKSIHCASEAILNLTLILWPRNQKVSKEGSGGPLGDPCPLPTSDSERMRGGEAFRIWYTSEPCCTNSDPNVGGGEG